MVILLNISWINYICTSTGDFLTTKIAALTPVQAFSAQLKTKPDVFKLFTTPAISFISFKTDNIQLPKDLATVVNFLIDGKKTESQAALQIANRNLARMQLSCETKRGVLNYEIDSNVIILTQDSTDILSNAVLDKDILPGLKGLQATFSEFSEWSGTMISKIPTHSEVIRNLSVETGKRAGILFELIQAVQYDQNELKINNIET